MGLPAQPASWIITISAPDTRVPLGVPAVIFGVGFLLTYSCPPLVLYAALMLPFGTRMLLATMIAMGNG